MYRILLVEDDEDLRIVFRHMTIWQEHGFEITAEAGNGLEALKYLENNEVEMVLTDIKMPGMNGIELLKQIKELYGDAIVVLMSSYTEFEYARQGIIFGAIDYIIKPIQMLNLKLVLDRVTMILQDRKKSGVIPNWLCQMLEEKNIPYDSAFLEKVFLYLTDNIAAGVTMDAVADMMKLSKDYFGKTIKQNTGHTFTEIISIAKIAYAKNLIKEGVYKNYEISDMLGYSTPDYFTKVFKEYAGMTPMAYKNLIK